MYKLLVLTAIVGLATCNELDQINGDWYPLAFFLPGEDVTSVYQLCRSTRYSKFDQTFFCGTHNLTGGVQTSLEDDLTAVVPATVVHSYEEATRMLNVLTDCTFLNVLRFIGNYVIAYNKNDMNNGINMFLMGKEVPTRHDLDAFIATVNELNTSEDEVILCSKEVMDRKRGQEDRTKKTSPLMLLSKKFFGKH